MGEMVGSGWSLMEEIRDMAASIECSTVERQMKTRT